MPRCRRSRQADRAWSSGMLRRRGAPATVGQGRLWRRRRAGLNGDGGCRGVLASCSLPWSEAFAHQGRSSLNLPWPGALSKSWPTEALRSGHDGKLLAHRRSQAHFSASFTGSAAEGLEQEPSSTEVGVTVVECTAGPFDALRFPFDRLKALSGVEGLRAISPRLSLAQRPSAPANTAGPFDALRLLRPISPRLSLAQRPKALSK